MKRVIIILINALLLLVIIGLITATWLPAIYTAAYGTSQTEIRNPK